MRSADSVRSLRRSGFSHEEATKHVVENFDLMQLTGNMGGVWGNIHDCMRALGLPKKYQDPAFWSIRGLVEAIPPIYATDVMTSALKCLHPCPHGQTST